MEEQQTPRKTLILKQRKLAFCSRLSLKHLKLFWVVIFGMIYSVVVLAQMFIVESYESFLKEQWIFSSRSIMWANSIHISWFLIDNGYETVNGINVR